MQKWIIIGVLLSLMSGGAYFYYTTTQNRIDSLIETNATLVSNVETITQANIENVNTIEEMVENEEQARQNFIQLETEFQEIRSQNSELRQRLGRHELDALAAAKPKLVENIINNASDNAIRCFELLSGAPLTEGEKNATNEKEFNSECPFLWPGSAD